LQYEIANTRLWAFALKIKIRRNQMSLYVGIDVGKFHHVACFLDDRENQLDELKFTQSYQGFSELEKIIQKHAIPEDGQTLLGMEATGHYWFPCMSS